MDIGYQDAGFDYNKDTYKSRKEEVLIPKFALVFHGDANCGYYEANFVTKHNIDDSRIGVGSFVTPESVVQMTEFALSETIKNYQEKRTGFIPEHILVDNARKTVWYRKSCKRNLLFLFSKMRYEIEFQCPALLFIRVKSGLRIFALKSDDRPTLDTKVYHAPFMNLSSNGVLCSGDAVLPTDISSDEEKLIENENCFFNYHSTHVNHSQTLKSNKLVTTNALFSYIKRQQKENADKFNIEDLSPLYKNISEVI